jgi:hypothetical protein
LTKKTERKKERKERKERKKRKKKFAGLKFETRPELIFLFV